MPVDPSLVGRAFPPTAPFTVTAEHVRSFAEATGSRYDGGPAPATYPIVLAFEAMSGFLAAEAIDLHRIVHGEQRFSYERAVVPGDVLTATLSVASLRHIGGADVIGTTSEVTDETGALVCTTAATLVHRGERMTPAPRTYLVTRADLVRYAAASGDHNPIHQDEDVALSVGLPGVIAHGMYTLALAARAVQEWFPGAEVVSLGAKFTRPVVVPDEGGAEVEVRGEVTEQAEGLTTVALTVTCAGQKVLGMPKAVVRA